MKLRIFAIIVLLLVSATWINARITPDDINYQGRLTDTEGNPVPDGTYTITFTFYPDQSGITPLWQVSIVTQVTNGFFNVIIRSIDDSIFYLFPEIYIAISIDEDPEMTPMTQITSVPYAFLAEEAFTGGGWTQNVSQSYIYTKIGGRNIGISNSSPSNTVTIGGNFEAESGDYITINNPNDYTGIIFGEDDTHNGTIFWDNDSNVVRIGVADNSGVFRTMAISKGAVAIGIDPRSDMGLRIDRLSYSTVSSYGIAVDQENNSYGTNYGVWAKGYRNYSGSTSNYVYGVYGYGSINGQYSRAIGVSGYGSGGSVAMGIYGTASGGYTSSYAGFFDGNVNVNGHLYKSSGAFRIDHPLDPENKYLQHSFVESPDMMDIYNGNIVLDQNGEAVVQMPDWFEPLNKDFRYQLTCIGGFAPVYIANEILDGNFKIAGGSPGLKVSWQVTGIRHDPYANANRIQVEVDKDASEVGLYRHPEVYGQPKEKAIGYHEVHEPSADAPIEN